MSDREIAKTLIDRIPQDQLLRVISYLRETAGIEETPNSETLKAMDELDCGGGVRFAGSTAGLFATLLSD